MRSALGLLLSTLALALALGVPTASATDDGATIALPLVLHAPGGALDAARVALVEGARDAYAAVAICFVVRVEALPAERRVLSGIPDRHALRALLRARGLNAFLVDRALDPHASESTRRAAARAGFEPGGLLAGAHIPAAGHHPSTYVIVTLDSSRYSLAHELGHVMGLAHSADPSSIMSYSRERSRFTEGETRTVRRRALRLLTTREVQRADPSSCAP